MAELDVLVQSAEYRGSGPPQWVFFHRLRLLLGWGEGLWESLGDQMSRVRTAFVIADRARPDLSDQLRNFLEWVDDVDRGRPPMPFYLRVLRQSAIACTCLHANSICETYAGPPTHALHGPEAHHPLEANENFRVAHEVGADGRIQLSIEKRSKSFKPELHAKVQEIIKGKEAYKAQRIAELIADKSARPPRFRVEMALQERIRWEEIDKGKRDWQGIPHTRYAPAELIVRTASAIADIEATGRVFNYSWKPVVQFDLNGLTTL